MVRNPDVSGKRRVSDPAFLGILVLLALSIVAGGVYLIGPAETSGAAPVPTLTPVPTAGRSLTPQPSPGTPSVTATPEGTEAGAVALVEKYFRLALAGEHAKACALQSPAYLRSDLERFPKGGCAAESRAAADAVAAKGIVLRFVDAEVLSFSDDKATVRTTLRVGTQEMAQDLYLGYRGGRWWLTGGVDSGGDVGY